MPLAQADRISFSLQIVQAAPKIAGLMTAQTQLNAVAAQIQSLDQANANLFSPVNTLINGYHGEIQNLDGNGRSSITEQDIQDSGNKKLQNHFFPNDTTATVPSLSSAHNVWTKVKPYALTYAIGKNYSEAFPTVTNETTLITSITALITSASSTQAIENVSGQHAVQGGTCSISGHTDQASCVAASGTWTPNSSLDTISSFPTVVTLKTNLAAAVTSLIALLNQELASIPTNDPDSTNNTQNTAARTNVSGVILPALNAWLANPDFNPVPGTVTTFAAFYAFNPVLLAPTKLYAPQLAILQSALNSRSTFITTRISQVAGILGTIVQDLSTGELTSSTGLYGKRYSYLVLRLNALGGSLTQLLGLQTAGGAQTSVITGIQDSTKTYSGILPTSLLKANGSGSTTINLVDSSFLSAGDTVYVFAEGQEEIQRAVKSAANGLVVLNDVVPAKYSTGSSARLYKDLS